MTQALNSNSDNKIQSNSVTICPILIASEYCEEYIVSECVYNKYAV